MIEGHRVETRGAIRDHGAFQRSALLLVGLGGALGVLYGLVWISLPDALLAAVVGAAALALVLGERRDGRLAAVVSALGVLGGVGLAWLTYRAMAAGGPAGWSLVENAAAGALFGLVASLGLLPAHLGWRGPDRVAASFAAARAAPEESALLERAARARGRIHAGLAGDASPSARQLREGADALSLQMVGLANRCRDLRQELGATDLQEHERRSAALDAEAGATDDPAAREDFARAARTAAEVGERVRLLRGALDRVRARLSLQVATLEGTALALCTRRASSVAHEAAALAPLTERVREAGADLDAETLAFNEASA